MIENSGPLSTSLSMTVIMLELLENLQNLKLEVVLVMTFLQAVSIILIVLYLEVLYQSSFYQHHKGVVPT